MVGYTSASGYVIDGLNRPQYADRNDASGVQGTFLTADDQNMNRNELVNAVKASGQVLDGKNHGQLALACQILGNIRPWSKILSDALGGYWLGAIIVDSSGAYLVSTAASNTTVPGAAGANWKSLFDGVSTQSWAQRYLVHSGGGQGGTDAGVNVIVLSWVDNRLHLGVDNTDIGNIASENWTNENFLTSATAASTYATQSALTTEADNRTDADNVLQKALTTEATIRGNADGTLQEALTTEAKTRADADKALQDSKQDNLGFTPVQQGGGANQSTNKIYLGWGNTNHIRAQVDTTDVGDLAYVSELPTSGTITGGTYTKTPMNDGTGRSVLRQKFAVTVPSGPSYHLISFPFSYSSVPSVTAISSRELNGSNYATVVCLWSETVGASNFTTTSSVLLMVNSIQPNTVSPAPTSSVIVIDVEGIA